MGHVAYKSKRHDDTNTMRPSPRTHLFSIVTYRWAKTICDLKWPQMTFTTLRIKFHPFVKKSTLKKYQPYQAILQISPIVEGKCAMGEFYFSELYDLRLDLLGKELETIRKNLWRAFERFFHLSPRNLWAELVELTFVESSVHFFLCIF